MTHATPWQQMLARGNEQVQQGVIEQYRRARHVRSHVPDLVWGTLQTEAYATDVLEKVAAFLGTPDDIAAGVAKRMERQRFLHDSDRRFDVLLGEQALYTDFGGPQVMRSQMERLLTDLDLPTLHLGVIPAAARLHTLPATGFTIYGEESAHVELVSSGVDFTDPAEIALHAKAFDLLSRSAVYGDQARALIAKALDFWSR